MKKLSRVGMFGLLALLLAGLIAGAVLLMDRANEPKYQGQRITLLFDDWAAKKPGVPYYDALRSVGTNAMPYALRHIARNDSAWQKKYHDTWPKLPAFLRKILPVPKPNLQVVDGANVFFCIGPAALPQGYRWLKHGSLSVRQAAACGLGAVRRTSPQGDEAVPALIEALADPDQHVRQMAASSLQYMQAAASNAVPALTKIVADPSADIGVGRYPSTIFSLRVTSSRTLGKIGPPAQSAVPTLRQALQSTNVNLRIDAAVAIWRITGDVETALLVLLRDLPNEDEYRKWDAIASLGEMGPRARVAIPQLTAELKQDRARWVLQQVTNALLKIDTEAAAKLGVFPAPSER